MRRDGPLRYAQVGIAGLLSVICVSACAVLAPLPEVASLDDRLAAFPTDGLPLDAPVTVRWNAHQIPFIEAATDGDAAFTLGMVHAHLRLGQMGLVRRIVQGRLSESVSFPAANLDAAIKAFDFYRAADAIYVSMPAESRAWIDRYVAGVNTYAARVGPDWRPHEFTVAGIEWEPWTAEDAIALGRAGGVDLNWEYLLAILAIEEPALRERVAARILSSGQTGATSLHAEDFGRLEGLRRFASFTARHGRSGSNSIVVGPEKSTSGAPLIANDPHLAFLLPNPWLLAGLRTPDTAIVGMMVPGTPVFGFGRTEHIAWGGTNLRATTSQLVDVSALPESAFEERRVGIGIRYLPDRTLTVRESRFGPVMSDLDLIGVSGAAFAVRWAGHTVTDEITALLGAMRARSVGDFAEAMKGFAFPPQTFLAADTEGRVAGLVALKVPARASEAGYPPLVTPEQSNADWTRLATGADLQRIVEPSKGFIASANNRPLEVGEIAYGGVFPQDERIRRLDALLSADDSITAEDLATIQRDVVSPLSLELVAALRPRISALADAEGAHAEALRLILDWDGAYGIESRGAAVFESFLTEFAPAVYVALGRSKEREIYEALGRGLAFLIEDMAALSEPAWHAVLERSLERAQRTAAEGIVWGDLHRLTVGHVFVNAPLLGERYRVGSIPMPGSRETVLKSAHPQTDAPHESFFGSQSRHISDLSDPDQNLFVLLGGQDGWINSTTFADQVTLWRDGRSVRLPLRPQSVRQHFDRVLELDMALTAPTR